MAQMAKIDSLFKMMKQQGASDLISPPVRRPCSACTVRLRSSIILR